MPEITQQLATDQRELKPPDTSGTPAAAQAPRGGPRVNARVREDTCVCTAVGLRVHTCVPVWRVPTKSLTGGYLPWKTVLHFVLFKHHRTSTGHTLSQK